MIAGQYTQLIAVLIVVKAYDTCLIRHCQLIELDNRNRFQSAPRQSMTIQTPTVAHALQNHESDHNNKAQCHENGKGQQQMCVDVERQVVVENEKKVILLVCFDQKLSGLFANEYTGNGNVTAIFGRHWF